MKLLIVNGSPRREAACSALLARAVQTQVPAGASIITVYTATAFEASAGHLEADALVIAFPLYVDCLPSGLIRYLRSYADLARMTERTGPCPTVFAVCNCGFPEPEQNRLALEVVRHFAQAAGLRFGFGLGLGMGEMFRETKEVPDSVFFKKPLAAFLAAAAAEFSATLGGAEPSGELRFAKFKFPDWMYAWSARLGWNRQAATHGLKPRDLRAQPFATPKS